MTGARAASPPARPQRARNPAGTPRFYRRPAATTQTPSLMQTFKEAVRILPPPLRGRGVRGGTLPKSPGVQKSAPERTLTPSRRSPPRSPVVLGRSAGKGAKCPDRLRGGEGPGRPVGGGGLSPPAVRGLGWSLPCFCWQESEEGSASCPPGASIRLPQGRGRGRGRERNPSGRNVRSGATSAWGA